MWTLLETIFRKALKKDFLWPFLQSILMDIFNKEGPIFALLRMLIRKVLNMEGPF